MPPRSNATTEAAGALAAVAPLVSRWIERLLAASEPPLTSSQYLALRAIAGGGASGSDLARRAGVSGPAVSQLLAGLTDAGLVERRADPADRRRQTLALTAAGRRVLAATESALGTELKSLVDPLPAPEAHALARLLTRVEEELAGIAPPRRPAPPRPGAGPARRPRPPRR